MKKLLAILLAIAMVFTLAACSSGGSGDTAEAPAEESEAPAEEGSGDGEGLVYGFVSKTTADPMFVGTYEGFEEACGELGIETFYRGTEDASAEKEIEIVNQLIAQGVDGIAIIAADEDALQPVLQQAMDAGIPVVSVDSATNAASRNLHVDFAETVDLGRKMFASAAKECDYNGTIGVLNGDPRVSIFQDFDEGILAEYNEGKDTTYKDVTLIEDFAYGYDLPDQSTTEGQALIKNHPDMDVICCPTTVAILAAAKLIQDGGLDMKVTGIGLPSECVSYFDNGIIDEMWLWNIYDYGYLTCYALYAIQQGQATGAEGETIDGGKLGTYTIEHRDVDDGTMIMMGEGYLFDNSNIHDWVDKL